MLSQGSTERDDLADRIAVRDLVDAYAHHADRGDAAAQAGVFTEDGTVRLFEGDPLRTRPVDEIVGHEALTQTFAGLVGRYDATYYLNGQSRIVLAGDEAAGESYCLAHHLVHEDGERVMITMAIRYLDRFVRAADGWRIARRDLVFDWTDRRPSRP